MKIGTGDSGRRRSAGGADRLGGLQDHADDFAESHRHDRQIVASKTQAWQTDDQPGDQRGGAGGRGALQPGDDNASPRVGPGGDRWQQPGARRGRSFRVSCDYVKSGMFDPIVFPGVDGKGHDHQFFGAESISPDSTPASLVAANAAFDSTSCTQVRDGSAYWMPASVRIASSSIGMRSFAPPHSAIGVYAK